MQNAFGIVNKLKTHHMAQALTLSHQTTSYSMIRATHAQCSFKLSSFDKPNYISNYYDKLSREEGQRVKLLFNSYPKNVRVYKDHIIILFVRFKVGT